MPIARNHHFIAPEVGAATLLRRRWRVVHDRASGVLFEKAPGRYIHVTPDGESQALAQAPGPCWAANCELAESADGRAAR